MINFNSFLFLVLPCGSKFHFKTYHTLISNGYFYFLIFNFDQLDYNNSIYICLMRSLYLTILHTTFAFNLIYCFAHLLFVFVHRASIINFMNSFLVILFNILVLNSLNFTFIFAFRIH